MSDNLTTSNIESMLGQSALNAPIPAGQMLKKARLDAGLHIAALAVSLRVPVKRIEALESGQLDQLPDMVFVRALTSSICQTLKIDPSLILERLPKAASPRLNSDEIAINTPIGISGSIKEQGVFGVFTSPWFLGVLLLCVGAAGIYFWPKTLALSVPEVALSPKNLTEIGVSQAKEVQLTAENSNSSNLTVSNSVAISSVVGSNESSAATEIVAKSVPEVAANVSAASLTAPTNASTETLAPITKTANERLVTFKATGQTWVEVKNSRGATVFKKLLNDGETAAATGQTPLLVIVGRSDVTQVEVRGKPLNLSLISKNNIARFEVN